MTSRGRLYAGTSGFAYKEWKGSFYPEDLKDREMLAFYSGKFPSVEVNYTFRRLPSEKALETWREQSAEGFQFTLKASQRITHFKRLKEAGDDIDEFVRRARLLGDRLGLIFFQLPPNFKFDGPRFESFLAALPPVCRYAIEFRNSTWATEEVSQMLSGSGVALCGADTAESELQSIPATAPFSYLRLRREEYSDEDVDMWGKRVAAMLDEGRDVYCYFKHEGGGVGPRYAARLMEAASG